MTHIRGVDCTYLVCQPISKFSMWDQHVGYFPTVFSFFSRKIIFLMVAYIFCHPCYLVYFLNLQDTLIPRSCRCFVECGLSLIYEHDNVGYQKIKWILGDTWCISLAICYPAGFSFLFPVSGIQHIWNFRGIFFCIYDYPLKHIII